MTEVTLFANLFLIAVSSSSVLVAIVLSLLFRRKESFSWSMILLGLLMLTSGKVVYQFMAEVLLATGPDPLIGLWMREAWFALGRALIVVFVPQFLRLVTSHPQGARKGNHLWLAGVCWTLLALGWLVWFALAPSSEAVGWAAWGLFAGFSVLVLVGVGRFARYNGRSRDWFLRAFGWFLVSVSLLLVSLTLAKNYFGFTLGGSYDVVVNSLYCLLFAAGAWYTFRTQKTMTQLPDDQRVVARLQSSGLSAREQEITQLVVEGLSNHDIAQALFISPKTVENHLYRIYQKTGVRNRVQLYLRLRS